MLMHSSIHRGRCMLLCVNAIGSLLFDAPQPAIPDAVQLTAGTL